MVSTNEGPRRRAPSGLKARGKAFWASTIDRYELSESEIALLVEACRTMDQLDALADVVSRDGATVSGSTGQTVVHPALTEARGQRVVLHRMLAALALPEEDDSALPSARSAAASVAAQRRWSGQATEAPLRRAEGA